MNVLTKQYRITDTHFFFWNTIYSQWYSKKNEYLFEEDGNQFWTAEHYMMYAKAKLFNDETIMLQILNGDDSPKRVKELGRKIKGFNGAVWDLHKMDIVVQGNVLKFSQNPDLLKIMKQHQNLFLVEASPVDNIWGIGKHFVDEDVINPETWKGQNLLGQALMLARTKLLGL